MSAHHGLFGHRFDFRRHPIAPVGCKVLTWDSPDARGSWADHGVHGIYLGPAMRHFRGFNIWVPQTSATRVSGTVWWFFKPFVASDDLLSPEQDQIQYPDNKARVSPQPNGADLLGRCFLEPAAGICCITQLGPVTSDAEDDSVAHTLHYRCLQNQAEYISTVEQIASWLEEGPLLLKPAREPTPLPVAPVTYPAYYPANHDKPTNVPFQATNLAPQTGTLPIIPPTIPTTIDVTPTNADPDSIELRRSKRKRKAPDFLRPKWKGQAYVTMLGTRLPGKQSERIAKRF
jgi:hypothetical protein